MSLGGSGPNFGPSSDAGDDRSDDDGDAGSGIRYISRTELFRTGAADTRARTGARAADGFPFFTTKFFCKQKWTGKKEFFSDIFFYILLESHLAI